MTPIPPMNERERFTDHFQEHRGHLFAVAYRILGSVTEAEDAVQEAWLRIRDRDSSDVENPRAWLTTVVGRICLNMLRSRRARREEPLEVHVPDPVVSFRSTPTPEDEALLSDSAGLALLVVLNRLSPAERLAFVLHDVFDVPFSDIAAVLDRSEAAAQQLASRARRRVKDAPAPDRDPERQRRVVDAFFAAARDGDFDALVRILHPDVELRIDGGTRRRHASLLLRGAEAVAAHTRTYSRFYPFIVPASVNGTAGAIIASHRRPFAVMGFTVSSERITAIEVLMDPERLHRLNLTIQ
jgi:RNA polymerase sigma factor (sigma-70 family)